MAKTFSTPNSSWLFSISFLIKEVSKLEKILTMELLSNKKGDYHRSNVVERRGYARKNRSSCVVASLFLVVIV